MRQYLPEIVHQEDFPGRRTLCWRRSGRLGRVGLSVVPADLPAEDFQRVISFPPQRFRFLTGVCRPAHRCPVERGPPGNQPAVCRKNHRERMLVADMGAV